MEKWTTAFIGPQIGKTALITNVDDLGIAVAQELALNGAKVIFCAEDVATGEQALSDLRSEIGNSDASYELVDLADLSSVKSFTDRFRYHHRELHYLIHNSDVSDLPERIHSAQGHELMLARNYLAQFVLTAKLFPLLERAHDARVIFQTAQEHASGVIDFFDLDATHYYESKKAYAQSKLAILIFARELDRRLRETHMDVKSIPVQAAQMPMVSKILRFASHKSSQVEAWPILFAATDPHAKSGHFYGGKSHPLELDTPIQAKNIHAAEKLWEISEEMTGVDFSLLDLSNVLPFQMRGNIEPELFT